MSNTTKPKKRWFLRIELLLLVCAVCLLIFKSVTDNVDRAYAQTCIGDRYFEAGQYEQAAKAYEESIRINPFKDSMDYYNLGITYESLGRYEDSIEAYKQALDIEPDDAYAYNGLGSAYDQLHLSHEAIPAMLKAVQLEPTDSEMWQDLGDAYASGGHYEEAIKAYKATLQIDPDWLWPHVALAWTYYNDLQRYDEAIDAWKQVIQRDPNAAGCHLLLGCSYEKAGKLQNAQFYFNKSKELNPNLAEEIFQNGNEAYDSGDYDSAINCYSNVIRLEPDRADAHYGLGKTYLQLKKKNLAMEEYKILKTLDDELAKDLSVLINQ